MASDVWTTIRVSRSGRLAILEAVGLGDPQAELGRGAFDELSLSQNLYVGGVPTFRLVSPFVKARRNLDGCVQKVREVCPRPAVRVHKGERARVLCCSSKMVLGGIYLTGF